MTAATSDLVMSSMGVIGQWDYDAIDVQADALKAAADSRMLRLLLAAGEMPASAARVFAVRWARCERELAAANKILCSLPGGRAVRIGGAS